MDKKESLGNFYISVKDFGTGEICEKKSRFIAYVKPVETEDAAIEFLNTIKQKHRDARHNVYAYKTRHNNVMRYSDDGEPQGTAGIPILDIINKEGLTDIAIVVTRYFGGILLGTGGLVHAYSAAAKLGIQNAKKVQMILCKKITVDCDYNMIGKVKYEAMGFEGAMCGEERYTQRAEADFYLPIDAADEFIKRIIDKTNALADIKQGKEEYFEKEI